MGNSQIYIVEIQKDAYTGARSLSLSLSVSVCLCPCLCLGLSVSCLSLSERERDLVALSRTHLLMSDHIWHMTTNENMQPAEM